MAPPQIVSEDEQISTRETKLQAALENYLKKMEEQRAATSVSTESPSMRAFHGLLAIRGMCNYLLEIPHFRRALDEKLRYLTWTFLQANPDYLKIDSLVPVLSKYITDLDDEELKIAFKAFIEKHEVQFGGGSEAQPYGIASQASQENQGIADIASAAASSQRRQNEAAQALWHIVCLVNKSFELGAYYRNSAQQEGLIHILEMELGINMEPLSKLPECRALLQYMCSLCETMLTGGGPGILEFFNAAVTKFLTSTPTTTTSSSSSSSAIAGAEEKEDEKPAILADTTAAPALEEDDEDEDGAEQSAATSLQGNATQVSSGEASAAQEVEQQHKKKKKKTGKRTHHHRKHKRR